MTAPNSSSVRDLRPDLHADAPPPELMLVAGDIGAALAYTAAAGWHLIPRPALVDAIAAAAPVAYDVVDGWRLIPPASRPSAETQAPPPETGEPTAFAPSLASLPQWVAEVNRHLLIEQGYT